MVDSQDLVLLLFSAAAVITCFQSFYGQNIPSVDRCWKGLIGGNKEPTKINR